jgi:hypothetical protein
LGISKPKKFLRGVFFSSEELIIPLDETVSPQRSFILLRGVLFSSEEFFSPQRSFFLLGGINLAQSRIRTGV